MKERIYSFVDHTNGDVNCTFRDIEKLCHEAVTHGFRAVNVNLLWVKTAVELLKKSGGSVKVSAIIDFPLGAGGLESKIHQAQLAKKMGANEIDTVINLGYFLDGKYDAIEEEIREINSILPTKFIIEHALLSDEQVLKIAELLHRNNAFCLKLASGFVLSSQDMKINHVRLIKKNFPHLTIKASGKIQNMKEWLELIEAGARIIGSSRAIPIITESR